MWPGAEAGVGLLAHPVFVERVALASMWPGAEAGVGLRRPTSGSAATSCFNVARR